MALLLVPPKQSFTHAWLLTVTESVVFSNTTLWMLLIVQHTTLEERFKFCFFPRKGLALYFALWCNFHAPYFRLKPKKCRIVIQAAMTSCDQIAARILFVSSTHHTPDPWHRNLSRAGEHLCTWSPSAANRLWSNTRKHSHLLGWRNKTSLEKYTDTGGTKRRLSAKVRGERATNNRTLKNNLFLPFLCHFISAVFCKLTCACIFTTQILDRHPSTVISASSLNPSMVGFAVLSSLLHAGSNVNAIISPAKLPLASEKAHSRTDSKPHFF